MEPLTMTTNTTEVKDQGGARDTRILLPLWRIRGTITLKTPLSIGSGRDEPISGVDGQNDRHVIAVVRDSKNRPYIPASSLKGALNALARESDLDASMRACLFGDEQGDKTTPAHLEICHLLSTGDLPANSDLPNWKTKEQPHPHTANLPHVVRNRDTGTAEDKLLFLEQVVPQGCSFAFECTARAVDASAIQAFLGLLELAGNAESPLRLGGGKSTDNGRITWKHEETRQVEDLSGLWKALANPSGKAPADIWSDQCSKKKPEIKPATLKLAGPGWLNLPGLTLDFHTPFLVYQARSSSAGDQAPNGTPRKNSDGRYVLPASSLHGALRSQAERILRTVGEKTPEGYKVPAVHNIGDAAAKLDLASVLFGASGWRSVIRISDFLAPKGAATLTHEMVAIDRLTGGGKDSAKFNIEVLDCPKLTGSLGIDLRRLQILEEKGNHDLVAQALGLLAHVLRDLDEGDIPLGYGAAKGYGRSRSATWKVLAKGIEQRQLGKIDSLDKALKAFSDRVGTVPAATVLNAPQGNETALTPRSSTGDFHNPYVFIPFGKAKRDDARLPWAKYDSINILADSHHSHARYAPGTFNGRLVCSLKTVTPVFIGAGDEENQNQDPKLKKNFKLNKEIALPATSLRGMLSSLHESITRSRMRVMDDGRYSVRASMESAMSAVGRVLVIGGRHWLQMLALPTLELVRDTAAIPEGYRMLLPDFRRVNAPLKSLIADRVNDPLPDAYKSYSFGNGARWYMDNRAQGSISIESSRMYLELNNNDAFHIKEVGGRRYLLGKRRTVGERPITVEAAKEVRANNPKAELERGVVRIMHASGRDLVESRKHEMFLPLSQDQEKVTNAILQRLNKTALSEVTEHDLKNIDLTKDFRLLPIPSETIDRFYRLADEMTKSQDNENALGTHQVRPYHPIDTPRNKKGDQVLNGAKIKPEHLDRVVRLKHCDLVFFRPDGRGTKIDEIAHSSIWRTEVDMDIAEWVGDDAASLSSQRTNGNLLSPSELLFGCVEVGEKKTDDQRRTEQQIMAFASKVHFGFGPALKQVPLLDAVTLKILSSPKTPSPAMYFQPAKNAASRYIAKGDLAKSPRDYALKGRKVYLHGLREGGQHAHGVTLLDRNGYVKQGGCPPWQSQPPERTATPQDRDDYIRANNQRVRVTPIREGTEFVFEVDFVNLSQAELESLCASLIPHSSYEHKIGMGKPIGLGSVKLDILGMYLVDRANRYRQSAFSATDRYATVWKAGATNLPGHLRQEGIAAAHESDISPRSLSHVQMSALMDQDSAVFNAIVLSGNPKAVNLPVHYPQLEKQDIEKKIFDWFVNNDKAPSSWDGPQQHLAAITPKSAALPALGRVPRRQRPRNR